MSEHEGMGTRWNIMKQAAENAQPGNHLSHALLASYVRCRGTPGAVFAKYLNSLPVRQAEAGFYQLGRHGFEVKVHI